MQAELTGERLTVGEDDRGGEMEMADDWRQKDSEETLDVRWRGATWLARTPAVCDAAGVAAGTAAKKGGVTRQHTPADAAAAAAVAAATRCCHWRTTLPQSTFIHSSGRTLPTTSPRTTSTNPYFHEQKPALPARVEVDSLTFQLLLPQGSDWTTTPTRDFKEGALARHEAVNVEETEILKLILPPARHCRRPLSL